MRAGAASARDRFRPDIEGLRAVAVLAVVLFHAGVPGAGGGYVGVDVFFVISGFLITGLLRREIDQTGTVRLARFYGARARRLLPAATVVLLATVAGSVWLLPPLQARSVLGDAVASALYAVNYGLAVQGTDYLAADAPPSPFQHYWSLGVEEQFYLLWPALLLLATALGRRRGTRRPAAVVLTVVTVASLVVSLLWTRTSPPWAYFSLPSRAWELGVGGLLAVSAPLWRRLGGVAAAVTGWTGLALVVVAVVALGPSTPFPGTAALLPVAGAAFVLGAGCAGSRAGAGVLLSVPPLRAVGRWSYSWYLWHWPVLLLAPHVLGRSLGLPARLAAAGVSLVLAIATVRLLENPVRFSARLRRSPGRSVALGAGLAAVGVAVALVGMVVVPPPVGSGAAARPARISPAGQAAAATDPSESPGDAQVRRLTAQVAAAVAASARRQDVPSNLTPALQDAADDSQLPFQQGCVLSWTAVTVRDCVYGDPAGQGTIALIGDSHAAQWFPALEPVAEQRHERLDVQSKVTCPLMDLPITSPYLGREYTECEQWRVHVLDRIRTERPALVVVATAHRYGADFGFTSYDPQWLAGVTRLVGDLRATGARVLVLGPVPDPHGNVPTCLSEHLDSVGACSPSRDAGIDRAGVAAEERAVADGGGEYADLTDLFCTAATCPVVIGSDLVFRDDNHLTPEYAALLAPVLQALVERATAAR